MTSPQFRTNVRANTQRLFDDGIAVRTFLAGEMRWDGQDLDFMHSAIVGKPLQEDPPASVMDAFCQFSVADHVADLKVFIGNQVVRRDQRVFPASGQKSVALPFALSDAARPGLFALSFD